MDVFQSAAMVVILNNGIIEAIVQGVKAKNPNEDLWFMMFVSWVTGGVLSVAFGLNLFVAMVPNPVIGMIITAIVVGRGANLLADVINALKNMVPRVTSLVQEKLS